MALCEDLIGMKMNLVSYGFSDQPKMALYKDLIRMTLKMTYSRGVVQFLEKTIKFSSHGWSSLTRILRALNNSRNIISFELLLPMNSYHTMAFFIMALTNKESS